MIAVYDKLIYFNEASKYTILRMRTDDPSVPEEARSQYTFRDRMLRFTAVGYGLPQTDSVKLEIEGDWKEGKYGLQLHVEHWHELVPPTTEGLLSYLSSGLLKGIGESTARSIVQRFGTDALDVLEYHPEKLLEKGFETPCPIAYIEETKMGLIGHSYFMSVQSPYRYNFCQFGNADIKSCEDVVTAFAEFTARLHEAGILHLDYSPGNILYDKIGEEYHFSLVDINRMHFGEVDIKKGCANFARLWGQTPFFILLGKEYARSRGMDEEECVRLILHYRKKFWNRYRRRHQVWFQLDI